MAKSIEYYISMGFDEKVAEYFSSGRKKAVDVAARDDMTIIIAFDNGEKRMFDVKPLIKPNSVFEPLSHLDVFERVYIDEFGAIAWDIDPKKDSKVCWNNKIDLSADMCYMDGVVVEDIINK